MGPELFQVDGWTDRHLTKLIVYFHRSQWSCNLRCDSAAARLLECGFESNHRHECLPLVSVMCWKEEVSALGCLFAQSYCVWCFSLWLSFDNAETLAHKGRANKPNTHMSKMAHSIHCCSNFFLFILPDQPSKLWRKCVYIHTYLTAQRLYMNYSCYHMIMWVKHFYRNREQCKVLTEYLSPGRRPGGDWANTFIWSYFLVKTWCLINVIYL
jgi:hypothetical protein